MKKVVTFGEIMLRLAAPGYLRFQQSNQLTSTFGGGEANVAVSLANYGIPVDYVTRLPQNDIGIWCEKEIKKHGVNTSNIIWGGERLGIYFLETGAVSRGSKVVYDRAHHLTPVTWSPLVAFRLKTVAGVNKPFVMLRRLHYVSINLI